MVNFNELHKRAARAQMEAATGRFTEVVEAAYPWLRSELSLGETAFGAVHLTSTKDIDRRNFELFGKELPQMTLFGGLFVPQNERLEAGVVEYKANGENMDFYYDESMPTHSVVQTIHTGHDDMYEPMVENPDHSFYTGTGYNGMTQEVYGLHGISDGVMPVNLLDYSQDRYLKRINMAANTIARATQFLGSIAAQQARPTMEVVTQIPTE